MKNNSKKGKAKKDKKIEEIENQQQQLSAEEKIFSIDDFTKKSDDFAREEARKRKERYEEKVKFLLNGKEISLKEINDIVIAAARKYEAMFYYKIPYYKNIYRLNEWHDKGYKKYRKPKSVADLTNILIYDRFGKDVIVSIHVLNGYLPLSWIRKYKNFQFLNDEGIKKVIEFRDQAIRVMEESQTMHEFRIKMRDLYNVPYSYQMKLY